MNQEESNVPTVQPLAILRVGEINREVVSGYAYVFDFLFENFAWQATSLFIHEVRPSSPQEESSQKTNYTGTQLEQLHVA